jgi:hypothetical protein
MAVYGGIVTHLEYMQVTNTLKGYNRAAQSLENIRNWWVALTTVEQAEPDNIDKLVDITENTLQSEQSGWVQQVQCLIYRSSKQGRVKLTQAQTGNRKAKNLLLRAVSLKQAKRLIQNPLIPEKEWQRDFRSVKPAHLWSVLGNYGSQKD